MNTLIAFRCHDASYVLVPHADARPWFKNTLVDFLGEVRADSFDGDTRSAIERQLGYQHFAWVSKDHFRYAWSDAKDRPTQASSEARIIIRNALHVPVRKRRTDPERSKAMH